MTQVRAAWYEPQPSFFCYRLEAPESHLIVLVLGIARPFPDIEPVDEEGSADVCGIVLAVKPPVAHQHMEAVDASR